MTRDRLTALEMDAGIESWREPGGGTPSAASTAEESALLSLFRLLRSNARLIAITALAVGLLAFGFSTLLPKRYTSTASLLFQQSPLVGQLTGFNEGNQFNTVAEEGATNVALVGSRPIAAETAARLGPGFDEETVMGMTDLEARPNTRVVDVTAEAATAAESARIANTYVEVFLAARKREVQRVIQQALVGLERELSGLSDEARNGAAGKELTQRIGTLRILSAVQSPNVELIQPAQVPELPASPRPKRNAVLGVLFGLLLGVGLAAVRQQVDQRLRELKDLESVARRPLLGTIPRHPALARATPPADLPPEVMDAFRSLELALRYRIGVKQTSCVMVTSVAAGEGKSVCAWHLAVAMAAAGKRTIYIDSDLRRPGAAKRFSLGQTMDLLHNQLAIGPGLADVLVGSAVRGEAVVRVPVSRVEERAVELDVLTAGEVTRSQSDLLDSPAMRELLDECAAEYDMIVVDAPAASNRVEAVALGRVVSGIVVVVSIGTTPRGDFERLQDDLEQMGTPVYGIVANGVRRPHSSGGR